MARAIKLLMLLLLWGCERHIEEAAAQPPDAASADAGQGVREPTKWRGDRSSKAADREQGAEKRRAAVVRALFTQAGVAFPPAELLLRGFKEESELEVWANGKSGEPLTLLARYGICRASGALGPKRREGDWQVPEGFYRVAHFNSASRFHLSLLVSYPNESDRLLGDRQTPGGEIMIHGDCRSRGCLAMSDERIEELWLMARATKSPVSVHLFPTRDIPALVKRNEHPEHHAFWKNLDDGKRLFDRTRRPLVVRVDGSGRYSFH